MAVSVSDAGVVVLLVLCKGSAAGMAARESSDAVASSRRCRHRMNQASSRLRSAKVELSATRHLPTTGSRICLHFHSSTTSTSKQFNQIHQESINQRSYAGLRNMSEKRKAEGERPVVDYRPGSGKKKQKQKGGFRVGPANLPDGTYKRKSASPDINDE